MPAPNTTAKGLKNRTFLLGLGAMKSGTTWLSKYLGSHPEFCHSPIKEMNYFNRLYDNPFKKDGEKYRVHRMENIILRRRFMSRKAQTKLRMLAQLGRIKNHEDYLVFFEEQIGTETHFGEISPSYSHLPEAGLRDIATLTSDVRFLFLMRDPTERAASHIQHVRRRLREHETIDDIIEAVDQSSPIFLRSDYNVTINALERAGVMDASRLMFYETLFCEESIRDFCRWLGIEYVEPDFETRLNVSSGEAVTEEQKLRIRERLSPIYDNLKLKLEDNSPAAWRW